MALVRRKAAGSLADSGIVGIHPSCFGAGRFAAEHWIHSHPSSRPCDVHTDPKFTWGYQYLQERVVRGSSTGQQDDDNNFALELAPRFPRKEWSEGCIYSDLKHRLNEYKLLYDKVPEDDWWGWRFWLDEV
ncbi:MAG: hypothetical protein SGARI_001711 [Bacillariaceae sp.]